MGRESPVFPVGLDEEALVEDSARLSPAGIEALAWLRKEISRCGGISRERLLVCQAEGQDGTQLPGCVKTYVPWPTGRFGAVMVAVGHPKHRIRLRVIAFGVRHHPAGSHALTVYEIAHRRLNG